MPNQPYQHQPSTSSESRSIRQRGKTKTPAELPKSRSKKPDGQESRNERQEKMYSPPPELPRDTKILTLRFELPLPKDDRKRVLASGGTYSLTVNEVTDTKAKEKTDLKDFVRRDLPHLNQVTVHFLLEKAFGHQRVIQFARCILKQLLHVSGQCRFKVMVDCMWPSHDDQEDADDLQRAKIIGEFNKLADSWDMKPPVIVE